MTDIDITTMQFAAQSAAPTGDVARDSRGATMRQPRPGKWELLALAAIVVVGAALRVYLLGEKSLWLDEIFYVSASQQGGLLGPYGSLSVAHPPGYLFLMRLVSSISEAEWVLRLPAMIASTAGLVALWALGRRMFGPVVGLLAAFFLALSPMHLEYAQEAHSYALFATLSTLVLWGLYRAAERETTEKPAQSGRLPRFWLRTWTPFILFAVLDLYVHYYAIAAVGLSLLIFPLFLLAASASSLPSLWRDPAKRRALLNLVIALAVVGLAFLPQLISQLAPTVVVAGERSLAVEAGNLQPVFRLDPKAFTDTLVAFVTYRPKWASDPLFFPAVTFLWLVGLVWLLARRTAAGIALALWMFLPLPLIAWFAYRTGFSFSPRRLIFILPVFMLVVATGVTAIARWGASIVTPARPGRRPLVMGVIIGVIVLAFIKGSYDPVAFYYRKPKQDWKTLAGILDTQPTDRDAVVLLPSANGPIQWYLTAEASVISENLVGELERLCQEHDAIYVAEATTRKPLSEEEARYLAENTVQVPLKDLMLNYRNCQPQAWYGAGAEKLFPLALHDRLSYPPTRHAQQEFATLAAQFAQESVQSGQVAPSAVAPAATPTDLPPTPTPSPTSTPEPVSPMDARTLLAAMVQEAPDDPLSQVRLGAFALQEGASPDEAGEYFQRAIELDNATWLAYGLWANSLANTGQISQSLQIVDQGLAAAPDSLALQTLQARFQDAPAATTSDDAYTAALEAGRSALRERNWDDAASAARQAIDLAPDRYEPQLVLGDAHRGLNEFAAALQAYTRATDLAPYLSILHGRQAEMLARMGRGHDAIAAGLTAVAIDQSRWENWYALGRAYAVQATSADPIVDASSARLAEASLLRAIELAPADNQTPARVLDDLRAAVARMQAASAASDSADDPAARRAAAQQSLQTGNADQALVTYRALVEADSLDRESRMGVAAALAALQRGDEALAEYERISADWPDFPFARIRQGLLLEEQGDLAGAITAYQAAVSIAPDNADAHFTLAYALRRAGQRDEAIAEFEAGLQLDPARDSAREVLDSLRAGE